jgi:hypothetical protein
LETSIKTRGIEIEVVIPEHRIRFDDHGGEPRNADLAIVGHTAGSRVVITVEAKADEPFGATVAETIVAALERSLKNPASQGVRRVEDLVRALLTPRNAGQTSVGELRYQLLTAVAGTVAYAIAEHADTAVLVVHEFLTDKTKDHLHARNAEDYRAFLTRLGAVDMVDNRSFSLTGPFRVPGTPIFQGVPALMVGKVTTNCRRLGM